MVTVEAGETAIDRGHDPEATARDIASKLASRARHVCMLIGAGASCSAGLPSLASLQEIVLERIDGSDKERITNLLQGRNLETALSRLRRIHGLLESEETLGGLSGEQAKLLDSEICSIIIEAVDSSTADLDSFVKLASWAARMDHQGPVELFTVNYDLLIERGLEYLRVPYFDGFIGGVEAPFLPDLVEPRDSPASRLIPPGFVRLWKLHGSANWRTIGEEASKVTIRVAASAPAGAAAIYPSDEKYEESRRVPFVVLMDRFRRAIVEPETIVITSGFSFGDDHLNELLFDAAMRHARSEVIALCFESIPAQLAERATSTRNLVVLAPEEAILDGRRAAWRESVDLPGVFENGRFLLGDFSHLAAFLSRQVEQPDARE